MYVTILGVHVTFCTQVSLAVLLKSKQPVYYKLSDYKQTHAHTYITHTVHIQYTYNRHAKDNRKQVIWAKKKGCWKAVN